MFAKIAFIILFVGLPILGGYEGANIGLCFLIGLGMVAVAAGCLWVQCQIEKRG